MKLLATATFIYFGVTFQEKLTKLIEIDTMSISINLG